jgi:hypothetical protein
MTTSDSVHFGEGPSSPSAGASDYSWWRNHLTPEEGLAWGLQTMGMGTRERIQLYQGLLLPGKSTVAVEMGIIIAQPLTKTTDFGPTDVFICQKWQSELRRKLVYIPEQGFCSLIAIVRTMDEPK